MSHDAQNQKGFTLLEFLIVVALIGILATLTVLALRGARSETRDADRITTASQIRTSLELGFAELANYPVQAEEAGDLRLGGSEAQLLCEANGTPRFVGNEATCTGTIFTSGIIPQAPTPADGTCTPVQNSYRYFAGSGGAHFAIEFCIGKATPQSGLANGQNCATPQGLEPGPCR
jgi:prepilin-type N-terminal cleavage/methylation domain-containing protein